MLNTLLNAFGALVAPLALFVIVLSFLLVIAFAELARRGVLDLPLRPLPAYDAVPEQVGRAVESGERVHISLGSGGVFSGETGTTIAALALLEEVASDAAISDQPPVATTSDATTLPLMSDTIYRAYVRRSSAGRFDLASGRLAALDATTLAGALTAVINDDEVQANILVGNFDADAALIAEAGARRGISQTIGSDRLGGQAVAFAAADHALIGQELFVARAYLNEEDPSALGGLAAQDVLRWVIIGSILAGIILKTVGII